MAAPPPSSSSLSSEEEVKLHPYQKRGPKGAYEAKQVTGSWNGGKKKSCRGLYVRVDMPGVPDDGVKISKYSDTRTVTFTGKAPVVWAHIDSSDRVYAGYVVLDRDPAMVDVECRVKNGSLHLFFPCSDGSLHFLSPNNSSIPPQQEYDDDTVELIEIGELFITHIEHAPEEPSGSFTSTSLCVLQVSQIFKGLSQCLLPIRRLSLR
ncbi:uncharacterized protein [Spinacia oleracea]|uniref:Uncharacterized protein isoform X2 n=1 Tax=Spinacia oleracea TaxID=3562 RepID=A0ABM3R0Z8_SPIOL|nr:uncharacterized protein LOC110788298 isoform X2 [Spinacia oleracea]